MKVTRIEAAQRQLATALELWFADGDPVSIHSLASNAHQVVHDLNRNAKGPELLFDSSAMKAESKKTVVAMLKAEQNFFKHADFRKGAVDDVLEFDPTLRSETFFYMTIRGLIFLGLHPTRLQIAYLVWARVHRPEWMSGDGWSEVAEHSVPVEIMERLRNYGRRDFLETFNKI